MDLLDQFKDFLFSQKDLPAKVTVKNYLSDVNHFTRWYEKEFNESFSPKLITHQTIEQYKKTNSETFSQSSMDRHLSSLRKFFKFLKLEGLTPLDPFVVHIANLQAQASDPWHIKDFKNFLYVYNASHLTIKNYIIDIRQFFTWAENVTGVNEAWDSKDKNVLNKIDNSLIEEYKNRLVNEGNFSPATVNRKLSSLRKYLNWAIEEKYVSDINHNFSNLQESPVNTKAELQAQFSNSNNKLKINDSGSEIPNKDYSGFPPLRLAQKISKIGIFAFDQFLTLPFTKAFDKVSYLTWLAKGRPVFAKLKTKNLKPKSQNGKWSMTNDKSLLGISNIPKEFYAPLDISTKYFPWYKKAWFTVRYKRPKWYTTYHSYPIAHYFNFAVLIIFMAVIGFGFYQSFFQKPSTDQPTLAVGLPNAPLHILSFQGRLTDNQDNPISTSSAMRFAIYNSQAPATGSALLWQEVNFVNPDQDGIFSILLGNVSPIPQWLFASNSALFLGVTVNITPELTPRQQLATVAFATNSELLQGLPPITQASAGTSNVVLALDSSGNLTIGGTANPTFQASGGQFTISGQPLLLTTNTGSNSNVTLSADGWGKIALNKPLISTSNSNNIPSAIGSVEVDSLFSILATSSGQSAITINQTGGGPLISASQSGTAKFTVDGSGNINIAGTYQVNGAPGISTTNACVNTTGGIVTGTGTCPTGNQYWQRTLNALSPTNITDDLIIGRTATPSASNQDYFQVFGIGNTGAGTTAGDASMSGTLTLGTNRTVNNTTLPTLSTERNMPFIIGGNTTGSIQLSPKGTTGLYVDPTGNVGIGTTSPDATLQINGGFHSGEGTWSQNNYFYTYKSNTVAADVSAIYGYRYSTAVNAPTNKTVGVLGIGEAWNLGAGNTLGWSVGVLGEGHGTAGANPGTVTNAASLYASNNNAGNNNITTKYGLYLENITNGSTNYSIYSAGGTNYFASNVGIGTTSPSQKLDINGNVQIDNLSGIYTGVNHYTYTQSQNGWTNSASTNTFWIKLMTITAVTGTNYGGINLHGIVNGGDDLQNGQEELYLKLNRSPGTTAITNVSRIAKFNSNKISTLRIVRTSANTDPTTTPVTYDVYILLGSAWLNNYQITWDYDPDPGYTTSFTNNQIETTTAPTGIAYQDENAQNMTLVNNGSYLQIGTTSIFGANVGIGTTSPIALLQINGGYANNAALIVNNLNSGDLFTASSSGTTKFTIGNTGALTDAAYGTNGGILYANGTNGPVAQTATGTSGYVLQSNGGGAPTWVSPTGLSAGNVPFSGITSGTNTVAAMVVGAGSSLNYTSTGTINASSLVGATWIAPGAIGSTTPNTGKFTSLWGTSLGVGYDPSIISGGVAAFNGNVGIGTTNPGASLDISSIQTTNNALQVSANSLTTGNALYLSSTSTTLSSGGLASLYWNPTSATTATGDLLSLNIGANGILGNIFNVKDNNSSVFSVSQTQVTSNLPTQFTSPGDVSIAYDINFTNPTASYIKSAAPLYLQAGETFNSSDLTLGTYNKGNVIVNSEAFVTNFAATVSSQLVVGTNTAPSNIGGFYLTNSSTFGNALAILNQTESQDIFTASASGVSKFTIGNTGNVGFSGALMPNNLPGSTGQILTSAGAGVAPTWSSTVPASSVPFSGITSGTNTIAAMVLGAGASLTYSGGVATSGVINANQLLGGTWAIPGTIGSTTPNTGKFTSLWGTSLGVGYDPSTISGGVAAFNGNVGIGTTSPLAKLHIVGTARVGGDPTYHGDLIINPTDNSGGAGGIEFKPDPNGNGYGTRITTAINGASTAYDLLFQYRTNSAAWTTGMTMAGLSGNVGIGTTNPTNKLEVAMSSNQLSLLGTTGIASGVAFTNGSILSQSNQFQIAATNGPISFYTGGTFDSMTAGTGRMTLSNAGGLSLGNAYVGTDAGAGNMIISGNVGIGTTAPTSTLTTYYTSQAPSLSDATKAGFNLWGSSSVRLLMGTDPASPYGTWIQATNLTYAYPINLNPLGGNVGIGTTSPQSPLQTQGANGSGVGIARFVTSDYVDASVGSGLLIKTGANSGNTYSELDALSSGFAVANNLVLQAGGGNVGIGTTSPSSFMLQVAGSVGPNATNSYDLGSSSLQWRNIYAQNIYQNGVLMSQYWQKNGTALSPATITDSVGIGTTAPESLLHVQGDIQLQPASGRSAVNATSRLIFKNVNLPLASGGLTAEIKSITTAYANDGNNDRTLTFLTGNGTNGATERMRIDALGNVGIGTTGPSQKLEVNGVIESPYLEFAPVVLYDFNTDTTSDWGKTNATLSIPTKSVTRYTTTSLDSNINRAFSFNGGQNQIIRIRYKWISGSASAGEIFYSTSGGHGFSGSFYKSFSLNTDGNWHTLVLDMSNLTFGGTDWIDNTITAIRFDLVNANPIILDLDWIAIGGNGWRSQYFEDDVAFMNGNVGIGTTGPSEKLDVSGNVRFSGALMPNNLPGTAGQFLISGGTGASPTWTSTIVATSLPFSGITSGTNTVAAMVVGTGASLTYHDGVATSGEINASLLQNANWAAPLAIGGTTPNTGAFTTLTASNTGAGALDVAGGIYAGTSNAFQIDTSGNISSTGTTGLTLSGAGADLNFTGTGPNQITTASGVNLALMPGGTGNVGIGTTNPTAKLHVVTSNIGPLDMFTVESTAGNAALALKGFSTSSYVYQTFYQGATGKFEMGIVPTSADFYINPNVQSGATNAALYIQKSTGNVGIGTTSPGANTNATGPLVDTTGAFVSTRGLNQNLPRFIFYDDKSNASYVSYDADAQTRFKSTSNWLFQSVGTGANIYTTGTTRFTIGGDGSLTATGTLTGLTGLTSSGTINFSGLTASSAVYTDGSKNLTSTAPGTGSIGYWQRNGTALSPATITDSVGIGTTSPAQKLAVIGNVDIGGGLSGRRLDVYNSANNGDGLAIGQDTDNSQTIQAYIDNNWTNRVTYASGCCNLLKLQPDVGTVQIGSGSNPTSGLSVYGASTFSSTINATGAITASQFNGSGAGLTGTGTSFTSGATNFVNSPDGDRLAGNKLPTTSPKGVRFDFATAASAGTSGNYAGVMTYAPWDGTTGSTGDASYQLAFGGTAANGGGIPQLNIRKGIDSTWNSWYTIPLLQNSTPGTQETGNLNISGAALFGGNVGIGTTSPQGKLSIGSGQADGAGNAANGIYFQDTNASGYGHGAIYSDGSAGYNGSLVFATDGDGLQNYNPTEKMRILYNGNVGIGTTSPQAALQIQSSNVNDTPRGDIILAKYWASNSDTRASSLFHYFDTSQTMDKLVFGVAGSGGSAVQPNQMSQAKMVIQANGNVGIGTTSPGANLEVWGTAPVVKITENPGIAGSSLLSIGAAGGAGNTGAIQILNTYIYSDEASGTTLAFGADRIAANAKMVINTTSGNVGIGTTTPTATLDLQGGNWGGRAALIVNQTGNSANDIFTASASGTTQFKLTNSGSIYARSFFDLDTTSYFLDPAATSTSLTTAGAVGIGTTTPNSPLTVKGINNIASVGTNLVTNNTFTGSATGWTLGTNWAYNSNNVIHTAGAAGDLSQNFTAVAGAYYEIDFAINSNTNGGCITPKLGTSNGLSNCNANQSVTQVIKANASGSIALTFSAASTFNGTIDNVYLSQITNSNPLATFINSDNSTGIEIRTGGDQTNLFLGYQSGVTNYGASQDTGVGELALSSELYGWENTALGYASLQYNTSGTRNTAVGNLALQKNLTGEFNTAIGDGALDYNQTGNYNTALGYNAGLTAMGSGNVFLGNSAGLSETGSNKLYIANSSSSTLIYGDFAAGTVGIGTTSPSSKLSLGSQYADYQNRIALYEGASSQFFRGIGMYSNGTDYGVAIWAKPGATSPTNANADFVVRDGGNVGIGTTAPGTKLEVGGALKLSGVSTDPGDHVVLFMNDTVSPYTGYLAGTTLGFNTGANSARTTRMYIDINGNVEIGTTSPRTMISTEPLFPSQTAKLDTLTGNSSGTYTEFATIEHPAMDGTAVTRRLGLIFKLSSESSLNESNKSGGIILDSANAYSNNPYLSLVTAGQKRLTITDGGNVGIGISPSYKLDVSGTVNATGLIYGNDKEMFNTGDTWLRINQNNAFTSGVWMNTSSLGIGNGDLFIGSNGTPTTSRIYMNGGTYNGTNVITLDGTNGNGTFAGAVRAGASAILSTGGAAGYYQDVTNGAYRAIVASTTTTGYYFQTNAGAATTMYVGLGGTYNGNVGIGTSAPLSALSVGGVGTSSYAIYGAGAAYGVYGAGTTDGVHGEAGAVAGYGVYGTNSFTSGTGAGVLGITTGTATGVYGKSTGSGMGVYGNSGTGYAVYGFTNSTGYGMYGQNTGTGYAIWCQATTAARCGGNQVWTNASDRRLKGNIQPIDNALALTKVLNLKGVTYYMLNDPEKTQQMGFIAQDVLPYAPEVISTGPDGYYGMSAGQLTALLVNAMQEQQTQIASLSASLAGISLTSTGDLSLIDQTVSDTNFTVPHYFTLNDALGNPIDRVGAFAELAVANLRAGFISAQQISTNTLSVTSENVTIGGQSLRNYIASVINDLGLTINGQKIISPLAEIDTIHTNFISPLAQNSNIGIKLENNKLSIVNGNSATASAVSSFDNQGNATFSGTIHANQSEISGNLTAGDASISGTLRAGKILATDIVGLNIQAATVSANYITNNYYNSTNSAFPTLLATPSNISSASSSLFGNIFASNSFINIATFSSQLAYVENLSASYATFNQGLMVFGATSLSDTSVTGQLSINGNFIISDNSINVLGNDLNLQPLKQGGLSVMAGLFYIDTSGNMKVGGNAEFAKNVTVKGTLATNIISPITGQDLSIGLSDKSKLSVNNSSNSAILAINQLGDLVASGSGTFGKLNLSLIQPAFALSTTEIVATGSAGTAVISAHQTELTIDNPLVTDKSLIYVTPKSNQIIYLMRQVPGVSFTVGVSAPSVVDIPFNWIIVN